MAEGIALIERASQEVFHYEPLSPEEVLAVMPDVELEHCPPGGATLLAALVSNDLNHYV